MADSVEGSISLAEIPQESRSRSRGESSVEAGDRSRGSADAPKSTRPMAEGWR
jgi:hypothetical protein